jgi:serine/threonine protein kinase
VLDVPARDALVLGRYRLLERLGAGGFGVVWRAEDELLQREVAVKRIALGPEEDGERASREALASARLAHPAIVSLYEACAVGDAFYLISELVHGATLAQLIATRGLSDEQVVEIGIALVGALSHAHSRGVIHRDVKPQNVLIPARPEESSSPGQTSPAVAKLTDFGGARVTGEDGLTRTGDVLGTLAYMAPEQSEGREVGEAADLYSLALVLYEALCGVNPVRGCTPADTVRRIGRPVTPLERRRRDLPRALTRALDTALAPSTAERGTLEELGLALEEALREALESALRAPRRERRRRRREQEAHEREAQEQEAHQQEAHGREVPEWQAHPERQPVADAPARAHGRRWLAEVDELLDWTDPERGDPQPSRAQRSRAERSRREGGVRGAPPRALWFACAVAAIVWQLWEGRGGVALLMLAAALPLVALPRRTSGGWLAGALAPVLGLAGLAGAFPAIAGQGARWRARAALGALGYWWLILAEPLLSRRLWLGEPAGTPPRAVWEGSLASAATHVVGPALSEGVLLGAALWAAGAVLLPVLVRGRSAVLDVVAATIWSAAIASSAPLLDSGLSGDAAHANPRGAVIGAVLGGVLAVAARALRGPV